MIDGLIRPFGPSILKVTLNKDIVESLNEQCDKVVEDQKVRTYLDASSKLSKGIKGKVTEELICNIKDESLSSFRAKIFDAVYFLHHDSSTQTTVTENIPKESFSLTMTNAWYVRSFAGDFHPLHHHCPTNDTSLVGISCIAYLKVPSTITDNTFGGHISFVHGSPTNMSTGNYTVKPEVGNMYFFSSYLSHTVYPFMGEGERRSFSGNILIKDMRESKNV